MVYIFHRCSGLLPFVFLSVSFYIRLYPLYMQKQEFRIPLILRKQEIGLKTPRGEEREKLRVEAGFAASAESVQGLGQAQRNALKASKALNRLSGTR